MYWHDMIFILEQLEVKLSSRGQVYRAEYSVQVQTLNIVSSQNKTNFT